MIWMYCILFQIYGLLGVNYINPDCAADLNYQATHTLAEARMSKGEILGLKVIKDIDSNQAAEWVH